MMLIINDFLILGISASRCLFESKLLHDSLASSWITDVLMRIVQVCLLRLLLDHTRLITIDELNFTIITRCIHRSCSFLAHLFAITSLFHTILKAIFLYLNISIFKCLQLLCFIVWLLMNVGLGNLIRIFLCHIWLIYWRCLFTWTTLFIILLLVLKLHLKFLYLNLLKFICSLYLFVILAYHAHFG